MKKMIWILLICVGFVSLALAQSTCPLLETTLSDALNLCDDMDAGTLCYGGGTLSIDAIAEDFTFGTPSDSIDLSSINTISTQDSDELAVAILRLNRDDVVLKLIAYGDTEIENTAPSRRIEVYALRGVNLRQEPSVEATVIGSLVQGQDYVAVGRLSDNSWLRIALDDGRVGWASAQYFSSVDGFSELDATTPATPPYLPLQSLTIQTGECGGLLIIAPEFEEESLIFGINGAQIQVNGIAHIQTSNNMLIITALDGDALVNAFGFELPLDAGELTSIPLSDTNTIVGIASDAESTDELVLSDDVIRLLLDE